MPVAADEVTELITALRTGALSLEDVAQRFRTRTWARTRRPSARDTYQEAEQLDPPLPVPGSIDDLTAAYDRGELTWEQYRVLAEAVAEAIDAE
jgi:hypothetical protein